MSRIGHRFKKGTPVRLVKANPQGPPLLAHRFGWVESSKGAGTNEMVTVRVQVWLPIRVLVRVPAARLVLLDPAEIARIDYLRQMRTGDDANAERFAEAVRKLKEAWRQMKGGGTAVERELTGKKGTKVLSIWHATDLNDWMAATFATSVRDLPWHEVNQDVLVSEYDDLVKANRHIVRLERSLFL